MIVTVSVQQVVGPVPSTLQSTAIAVSQGGTNLIGPGSQIPVLITQPSDLIPLLSAAQSIASIAWSSGVVTVTTAAPHGFPVEAVEPVNIVITGATPTAYNGEWPATITGTSTFTFSLSTNPGTPTVTGVVVGESAIQLNAMITTAFAQGAPNVSLYVLELGKGDTAVGVTTLTTWLNVNPHWAYWFIVPREWDSEPTFLALLQAYQAPSAMTYFAITTTGLTYTRYTNLQKCAYCMIEAPGIPATEFSIAASVAQYISIAPSATQQVPPACFGFRYGVTPYPTMGASAFLSALKTAKVNVIGTGYEGGIPTAMEIYGTTMDGRDFSYWYSVDWIQINVKINLANAIINGSNRQPPLYLSQPGIDTLESVVIATATSWVKFGMALGSPAPVVSATTFANYYASNPSQFEQGIYDGFSLIGTPNRGFEAIQINIQVTDFV